MWLNKKYLSFLVFRQAAWRLSNRKSPAIPLDPNPGEDRGLFDAGPRDLAHACAVDSKVEALATFHRFGRGNKRRNDRGSGDVAGYERAPALRATGVGLYGREGVARADLSGRNEAQLLSGADFPLVARLGRTGGKGTVLSASEREEVKGASAIPGLDDRHPPAQLETKRDQTCQGIAEGGAASEPSDTE